MSGYILTMPNGERLTVAEGQNPEEVVLAWEAGHNKAAGYDPATMGAPDIQAKGQEAMRGAAEAMPQMQQYAAGVEGGVREFGQQATNMLLPERYQPEWATDEALAAKKELDAPLRSTGAGGAGFLTGELLPGLIPGAGASKGLSAASKLHKTLAALNASKKTQYLALPAAESALQGAVLAGPGERGDGAMVGAATGAGTGAAMASVGRLLKGLAPTNAAGQRLAGEMADMGENQFLPLSSTSRGGTGATNAANYFYTNILPMAVGASGALKNQYTNSADAVLSTVLKKAAGKIKGARSPFGSGEQADEVFKNTGRFDEAVEDLIATRAANPNPILNRTAKGVSVLEKAVARAKHSGRPTPQDLNAASGTNKVDMGSKAPFKKMADDFSEVLGPELKTIKDSNILARAIFFGLTGAIGAVGGGPVGSAAAIGATMTVSRALASKMAQNIIRGTTPAHREFKKLLSEGKQEEAMKTLVSIYALDNVGELNAPDKEDQ